MAGVQEITEAKENKTEDDVTETKSDKEDCEEETADSGEEAAGDDVDNDNAVQGMSKRQQKKLKKHEQWMKWKQEKRKEEKLKKKRRFAELREKGELGPSRKALKKNSMGNSNCKVKVVLDCSFDKYMSEKDVRHLVQQIQHSYSCNRRADNPLQFYVCGLDGKTEERLKQIGDYRGWDVYFKTESYLETFSRESVVYLSSDSPTVLQELNEDQVYVIGGLVDHNHHKGLCHRLAEEKGVSHAQLPITEYIDMKTRKVLTVNHVFEILLRYTESRDWKKAFFHVLPQRKGVKVKEELEGADADTAPPSESEVVVATETGAVKSDQCNNFENSETVSEELEPGQSEGGSDGVAREVTPSDSQRQSSEVQGESS